MINDTLLLLQLRFQIARNNWLKRPWWYKIVYCVSIVVFSVGIGSFASFLGSGSAAVVRRFFDAGFESLMPGLILTAATVILLISAFSIALGTLFFSNDLELLMSAPVNRRAVFVSKLLDGVTWYYGILFVSAVPALVAYGLRLNYGVWYFVFALVAIVGAPLLTAGIGALAVMLVARFAPAHRVREFLGFLAAVFGLSCSLLGQTSRLWVDQLRQFETNPAALLSSVERFTMIPLPTLVAGRGLAAAGRGNVGEGVVLLAGYLALTFGFFFLCAIGADRLYTSGWTRMQSSGTAKRAPRDRQQAQRVGFWASAPHFLTIVLKDWRVIPRDLRNFAQILSPLLLVPIVYINIISGPSTRGRAPVSQFFQQIANSSGPLTLGDVGLAGGILFVSSLVFTRIALTSISMEGRSWWLLKVAPISAWELLRGKFLSAYLPFALVDVVFLVGAAIWRDVPFLVFVYSLLVTLTLGVGIISIGVGLSVPWARLDWDDPRRMSSGWGGFIAFLAQSMYALLGFGFFSLPALAYLWLPDLAFAAWLVAVVGIVILTAAVSFPLLAFGAHRVQFVGEK